MSASIHFASLSQDEKAAYDAVCDALGADLIATWSEPQRPDKTPSFDRQAAQAALDLGRAMDADDRSRASAFTQYWFKAGLAAARLLNDSSIEGLMLSTVAAYASHNPEARDKAQAYGEQAGRLAQETGDPYAQAMVSGLAGLLEADSGNHKEAVPHLMKAIHLYQTANRPARAAWAQLALARAHSQIGGIRLAEKYSQAAVAYFRQVGWHDTEAYCLTATGKFHLDAKDTRKAAQAYRAAAKLYQRHGLQAEYLGCQLGLAMCYIEAKQRSKTYRTLQTTIKQAEQGGHNDILVASLLWLADFHFRDVTQSHLAIDANEKAVEVATAHGNKLLLAQTQNQLAQRLWQTPILGRRAEAIDLLSISLAALGSNTANGVAGQSLEASRQMLSQWQTEIAAGGTQT